MPTTLLLNPELAAPIEVAREWLNLSLAQQAVWLDARLSDASEYQLGGWARVPGTLDEEVVRQTLALVVARHDALRLRVDDELPRQWLHTAAEPPLSVILLPRDEDPETAFHAHIERLFATPLPLGDEFLFQAHLFQAAEHTYLLWRFHHLIADAASVAIVQQLWANAFEALTSDTPTELAPPSSYRQILASDAAYVQSPGYDYDLAYWVSRFDPLPPPLIADMEQRIEASRQLSSAAHILKGEPLAALQNAAKAAGTSAQRALFALFAMTLVRRHGRWDMISGIALHRRDAASRFTVGMLAGVIGVRCAFEPFWTLEEGIKAFSEQTDADLRHQRMPLDIVARNLDLTSTGRSGLFEVAMSYMPNDASQPVAAGITGGHVSTREASPISLHIDETPDSTLAVHLAVNTAFLDAGEANTLLTLFEAAISTFTNVPDTRIEHLPALSPSERATFVDRAHGTNATFPSGTLDGIFAEQVARTPEAVAILSAEDAALSYAELDASASKLARQLAASGVLPGQTVGVQMPRSPETVIALLAILKAGAVYLPLDPAYPADRLAFMAKDADAIHILTSVDALFAEADLPPAKSLADPNRRAYIIYTSGTTGLPKGVAVPHAAAVNLAYARCAAHDPIGPGDRILAAISVGFDVSIGQLLLPLLSGATVVIAPELRTLAATELWALLARQRVTHINSVPSFFDSVLDAAPPIGTLALKRLMLGGEALTGALVARLHTALPGVEVVNMYGPTEACIDATFHVATQEDTAKATLPIGRPLPNYQAYVLDANLEATGTGITGELYLGGTGLAEGYLNVPELTAVRFVQSPFASGDRLYRTGDRARWSSAGELEFLGRVDEQVKIRGFRVEPAEIAAVLLQHPGVAQAVVVSSPGPSGLRLIAYFVPAAAASVEIIALRAHAAAYLPNYMVPAAFLSLKKLPLTQNGKLDLKALPKPETAANTFFAPRNPTEHAVAAIFAEVLGLERCGASANFFELGGHSLLAATLTSRLRFLGVRLPLRAVFDSPTVEALSRRIDLSLHDSAAAERILPQTRPAAIPLSLPQERLWFLDQLQGDATYNIPVAVELRGHLDLPALESALCSIVERHEILRTRILLRDGKPTQEVLPASSMFLSRVNLTGLSDNDREEALTAELASLAATPLDLAAGIPLAICLLTLEPQRNVVAAVIHHAAFDGWSADLFLAELQQIYTAFTAGKPNPLPQLELQYADFALWQRNQERSAGLTFWREELEGAPSLSQLPPSLVPSSPIHRPAAEHPFRMGKELYASVSKLGRQHNASMFMVLHAALALHLGRAAGQTDIVIGTVVANRERAELEAIIGCFVNTLPLRTRLASEETFADLLERVKNADLAAFAHQGQPFEQIVQLAQTRGFQGALHTTPLFQVLFVLQNTPQTASDLPGLTLHLLAMPPEFAQFDLTLNLTETGGAITGFVQYASNRYDTATIEAFTRGYFDLLEAVAADPLQTASLHAPAVVAKLPSTHEPALEHAFEPPMGEPEETLAILWADLLQVDRISRHDNFFELGGHSLLTITLIERLAQRGLHIDIRDLFTHPTIASLAERVVSVRASSAASGQSILHGTTVITPDLVPLTSLTQQEIDRIVALVPGGPANLQDIYPLASLQEGILFQHLLTPAADPYVTPFLLAFDTRTRLDSFFHALDRIVLRHDVLRTAVLWSNVDRPLQIVLREAAVPREMLAIDPENPDIDARDHLIAHIRTGKPTLRLDTAPLMRAVLAFDRPRDQWLVLLLTHHLILDHVSMSLVVAELRALMLDAAAPLPAPVPYRDFVAHTLASSQEVSHEAFFRRLLGDVTDPTAPFGQLTLPPNHNPNDFQEARLTLDPSLARRVRASATSIGVTSAGLFHLAWATVLAQTVNRNDVIFGTVLLGRSVVRSATTGSAVGMYINTLPIRIRLNDMSAIDCARATHQLLGEILLHEQAPLALAQRVSGVRAPTPLFSSLFNFRHSPEDAAASPWPGVEILFAEERTNYPLAMAVDDTGKTFVLTAISLNTVDPHALCSALERSIDSLVEQIEHRPDALLPTLSSSSRGLLDTPATQSYPTYQPPRTAAENTLQQLWQRTLTLDTIGIHDDFFSIGGDSLAAIRLLSAVNAALAIELPMRALFDAPTIAGMAAYLTAPAQSSCRIVGLQPYGSLPPLFCIHPAGGYVFCYLPLSRELGPDQPLFGIQAEGLEEDDPLPASIEEAAASHIFSLRQKQPEGPYQLLGMSSGGLIAFEMARQLRAFGSVVSLVTMLDTAVPSLRAEQSLSHENLLRAMAAELGCEDLLQPDLSSMGLADLVSHAQNSRRLPAGFTLAHAERIARVFANTAHIHNRYQTTPTDEPVLLIRATKRLNIADALPDWTPYTSPTSQIIDLDCDHASLVSEEWAPAVAKIVLSRLHKDSGNQ